MAYLLGREWTKRELLERVGDLQQIAGIEHFTYTDGVRDGVRAVRVRTGSGLEFTVLLSRGMDISHASFRGIPIAWVSATGAAHPHAFEPEGRGWLRTFHGGLMTTCGLSNAGAANLDNEEPLGIHGYASHLPAEEYGVQTKWNGDTAEFVVTGTLREARVFGENLRLVRRISARLGESTIRIEDRAENMGWQTSPLMLLYHLNFGWPLVSEDSEIRIASKETLPRDPVAETGLAHWMRFEKPQSGYQEQCFYHTPEANADGTASVSLVNPELPLGVRVDYDTKTLPFLTEWKMMGQGEYVCGIEPGNCRVLGRSEERAAGRLQYLAPGEECRFVVALTVVQGHES